MVSLKTGDRHYRAFVGPPEKYDIVAAMQFNLLTSLGLRENNYLLDLGCGSLRAGRLFIPYLLAERYFGIEPENWLIEEGILNETGQDIIQLKRPKFLNGTDFPIDKFGVSFDFIIAQSILSHTSPIQISHLFNKVANGLSKSGIFVATFVLGNTNYEGTEWAYPDCVEYTEDKMREFAEDVGLKMTIIDWMHPNGQTWALFYHKENSDKIYDPTYPYSLLNFKDTNFIDEHEWYVGHFEACWSVSGSKIMGNGWAKLPSDNISANEVLIVIGDSEVVGVIKVDKKRFDVSTVYSNKVLENSGWEFDIAYSRKKQLKVKAYLYLRNSNSALLIQNNFII